MSRRVPENAYELRKSGLGRARLHRPQLGALGRIARSRVDRTTRRQDHPSQVSRAARSAHRLGTAAIPSPADEVALGDPVERVLQPAHHTTDLTTSVLRSLEARPVTSSAKALRTRARSRPIASAYQLRARDAVNCDPRRHSMVESDHLRVFDGGSRLRGSSSGSW